jgi:hypothetical protein
MTRFILFVLLLLHLSVFTANAQRIKIDVQKGQKFQVETSTKSKSTAEVMGQSMENELDFRSVTVYEITALDADSFKMRSTVIKITALASGMGNELSYDSDKKDDQGPFAEMLGKIVNKPYNITINSNGTILRQDTLGFDFTEMMGGFSVDNAISTELFIPVLTGKELKTGESYSDIVEIKKDKFSSRDSGTYVVTNIRDHIASITYTGTQVITSVMEQMGNEIILSSNNTVKTEIQLEMKTGMMLSKESVVAISLIINTAGMSVPSGGKTTTAIKISRLE